MAFTAKDNETGAIIFPFEDGITTASCRDEMCGARVKAVQAVKVDDQQLRRAHWRHSIKNDGCRIHRNEDKMTEWHQKWQRARSKPEMIEFQLVKNGQLKRADVRTDYNWSIEFQHSPISQSEVTRRENFWDGRILWVLDGSGESTGGIDFYDGNLRWTSPLKAVWFIKTRVFIDDGTRLHLLPSFYQSQRSGDLEVPRERVKTWSHQQFIDLWMNSERMPIKSFKTQWGDSKNAKKRAKNRAKRSVDNAKQIRDRHRPCEFQGDRSKLIFDGKEVRQFGGICAVSGCESPSEILIKGEAVYQRVCLQHYKMVAS